MVDDDKGVILNFDSVRTPKRRKDVVVAETRDEEGRVIWRVFWDNPFVEQDWAIEPLAPRGRSIAIYCAAGIGKSELALFTGAGAATGKAVFDRPEGKPLVVVYLDYEMTENDLRGRLIDMGYGPEDDLSNLHYYLHPPFPPFDTKEGGDKIVEVCQEHKADLLILDTTSRVVTGDESNSDTYRDFHEHSGRRLKDIGVTVIRLDHAGKNIAAGQRGSSAKNDDVDVIWYLQRVKGGVQLIAEKRRQSWIPEEVYLERRLAPIQYRFSNGHVPESVLKIVQALDKYKVPLDATFRFARDALRKRQVSAKTELLQHALKHRRSTSELEV